MIKWKIKSEHEKKRNEFYFSKDGFCIKTLEDGSSVTEDHIVKKIWHLQIYYYTNDHKRIIFNQPYHAKYNVNRDVYESNIKHNATKLAKKFMAKYALRANSFFVNIAS